MLASIANTLRPARCAGAAACRAAGPRCRACGDTAQQLQLRRLVHKEHFHPDQR